PRISRCPGSLGRTGSHRSLRPCRLDCRKLRDQESSKVHAGLPSECVAPPSVKLPVAAVRLPDHTQGSARRKAKVGTWFSYRSSFLFPLAPQACKRKHKP